jgi:hypothetical protein
VQAAQSVTVCVDRNWRGEWEVGLVERPDRMYCRSLDDATRMARQLADRREPCELVVRDAYHRVIGRELIRAGVDRAAG